jgi:hypothetical protein
MTLIEWGCGNETHGMVLFTEREAAEDFGKKFHFDIEGHNIAMCPQHGVEWAYIQDINLTDQLNNELDGIRWAMLLACSTNPGVAIKNSLALEEHIYAARA